MTPQERKKVIKERVAALKKVPIKPTFQTTAVIATTKKTSALTEKQKGKFRKKLEFQRVKLLARIPTISRELQAELIDEAENNRDRSSTHIADIPANNSQTTALFASKHIKLLRKTQEALQRLDDGSYGICLDCGQAIDLKRLEATPIANLCCGCKTKKERKEKLDKNHRSFYPGIDRYYPPATAFV